MSELADTTLHLFFSRGTALRTWQENGSLERELKLYEELAPRLAGVRLVTYGGRDDPELVRGRPGLEVVCNRWGLHPRLYPPLLARVLPRFWPRPAVFKSNQAPGAGVMVAAARAAGAPCIVRAGYLPSNIAAWSHGPASPQARRLAREERRAFTAADLAVVTTREMAGQLARNYGVDPGRVRVVPNYVDTELFRPDPAAEPEPGRVVSVGRLHPEKNLAALVEAAAGLPVVLELIGSGPQARELAGLARRLGVELELPGPVPHAKLPARLARAQVFAFPSTGEHHPKSLLEAMSAGKAVVACRVPGVRELVDHGRTGWLTGTGPAELRQGLEAVLGQAGLRAGLGRRAREFCLERFALARVVDQELAVLAEAAA